LWSFDRGCSVRACDRISRAVFQPSNSATSIHFGGPDRPASLLRNLLEQRIQATPAGGSIDWMTYYFRDIALAEALVRARRRGVRVRVCVERWPRLRSANDPVIRLLADADHGIGSGLLPVKHLLPLHLHTKLYAFSHPKPHALVGSFHPSGNSPKDGKIVAQIGDHDRGHNLLVEVTDATLVAALVERVAELHSNNGSYKWRTRSAEAFVCGDAMEGFFFPLLCRSPLVSRLHALDRGASLRIAASHVRDPVMSKTLVRLVSRGVEVSLLTGNADHRAPRRVGDYLLRHGAAVYRFTDPAGLPMHSKFMLAESDCARWASFGSYNLTLSSRWLNHELLMFSENPDLWDALDRRWKEMLSSGSISRGADHLKFRL